MNTLWGWGRASWAGCGPDVRRGGQTLIMGYSADKSPLIGHLAGPLRRLEPLGAQRQEKCGPNRPTPTGYSCNNAAHKAPGVRALIEAAGATIKFLPPYSYDFNPIEPGWALVKKRIRAVAPRTAGLLRCTAQRARRVIRPRHCRSWFSHAGYQVN